MIRLVPLDGPHHRFTGGSEFLKTAVTLITLLRIIAVPFIFYLVVTAPDGVSRAAAILFTAAGFTDFLDGQIARRTSSGTEFGRKLDPVADRILIGGTLVSLTWVDLLPAIGLILVLLRDFFMILGYKFLQKRGVVLRVSLLGKSYTALFMVAIVLAIWGLEPGGVRLGWWMMWVGVAGSLITGVAYITGGLIRMKRMGNRS